MDERQRIAKLLGRADPMARPAYGMQPTYGQDEFGQPTMRDVFGRVCDGRGDEAAWVFDPFILGGPRVSRAIQHRHRK